MSDIQHNLQAAIELHQTGDLKAAEPLYQQVLTAVPHHLEAMYLLGTLQLQLGRFDESVGLLTDVCTAQPDVPAAHNNLGIALKAQGRLDESAARLRKAIKRDENYAEAHFNLGQVLQAQSRFSDAIDSYEQARQLDAADAQVLLHLGECHESLQQWRQAEECLREYLSAYPDETDARVRLGFVLTRQDNLEAAAAEYESIIQRQPDYVEIHNNLSYVYDRMGKLDEAVTAAEKAISLQPTFADGHNNLGNALRSLHRLEEAITAFERAQSLKPDFSLAEFNLATTRMLAGDLRGGWAGFEAREAIMPTPTVEFAQPRWHGERLDGGTLFIHADEGLGDTIQFVRFVALAKQHSQAHIVLQCQQQLSELLQVVAGIDHIIAEGEPVPKFDAHISLLSLPGLFETDWDSLTNSVPYLRAEPHHADRFADEFNRARDRMKVGIVWQGNPAQPRDIVRSCPLEKLAPLTSNPDIAFMSLQTGTSGLSQLAGCSFRESVTDIGSQLTNFAETAAVLNNLDLLISVDTSVAHLAGALGTPVWTMLSHTPDWRWLLGRQDSPWYPSMRLFRQQSWGDWDGVVRQVSDELRKRVGDSCS